MLHWLATLPFFKCLFKHSYVADDSDFNRYNKCSNCGHLTEKPLVGLICPSFHFFENWCRIYSEPGFLYTYLDETEEINEHLKYYLTFTPNGSHAGTSAFAICPNWRGWVPSNVYEKSAP